MLKPKLYEIMIPLPLSPKIVEKKENIAHFVIEALYPGFGVTVGNSLRRVLLSSLSGAAITQIKIRGVQHEFSTVPGVIEDVITIMLNLKQLRFKTYSDEPQKAVLKVKGEKEATGKEIDLSSQLELVNKNHHIATLTDKKTELEIELQIEKGMGYVSRETKAKEMGSMRQKIEIGIIPMDAIFTPIRRVSYKVENMRVGERTDFDKLTIELETDGTIDPEDAFTQACEILVQHYSLFINTYKKEEKEAESDLESEKKAEGSGDEMKIKVEDLKLSTRTLNALFKNNIKSTGAILKKSEKSLSEMEGMGDKAIKEIKKALKKHNLELKES